MKLAKLALDTSACSRIKNSQHRKSIEQHIDDNFRRIVTVPTFWELVDKIDGGDGSYFADDKDVIKVAAGTTRPILMLPNPLEYAIETVLKVSRPNLSLSPETLKRLYKVIMKAKTRDELYTGVHLVSGVRQVVVFDPGTVRQQQEDGEQAHVERLKWARRKLIPFPQPSEWATAMMKQVGVVLDSSQSHRMSTALDAAYQFDAHLWKSATVPGGNYNPQKHRNDWSDLQQTLYLCDPSIYLITADRPLCKRVSTSTQAAQVLYLPDYLRKNGLSL